jgi:N utilization substance protein A
LSGWNLDVTSETEYNNALKEAYKSLLSIDGVGEATATNLYQSGFRSVEDIIGASIDELVQIKGISEEKAQKLIEEAKIALETIQNNQMETGDKTEEETVLENPDSDIESRDPLDETEVLEEDLRND